MSQAAAAVPASELEVLLGKEDAYSGVLVDPEGLPLDAQQFSDQLRHSLQEWRRAGKRGIWLKMPLERAALVPAAVAAGFVPHHAERTYFMLTAWLADGEEDKLPANASHQVGIGAFVMNEQREVLLVQERNGPLKGKGVWKMCTGLCNQGEDVSEAAEREVLEETGIRAKFDAVLAVRQGHGFLHGKSDLFFVVALRLEAGPQELVMQEDELEAVRWMSLDEASQLPIMTSGPMFRTIWHRCVAYANGQRIGLTGRPLANGFNSRVDLLLAADVEERDGQHKL